MGRKPTLKADNPTRWAALVGALCLIGLGCNRTAPSFSSTEAPSAAADTTGNGRLVVLVVCDQMRADYLDRWRELWGQGGFRRLLTEGAWFLNCHYTHACTETGPGHATLATGRSPSSHGIVGNYWYDRHTAETVYCVAGVRPYQPVPTSAAGEGPSTPERLLGPTIGDVLREAPGRKGRVFSLSLKDRAAVLLAGRRPDACYWFDLWTGGFMTSTYYRDRPHPWVVEFNQSRSADRWFGKDWTRLRPDLDYSHHSGPEAVPGGGTGWLQKRAFPHPTTGGLDRLQGQPYANKDYYGAISTSPFGNELLLELALKAVDAENLGSSDSRDLFYLSFSAIDAIGHSWGPDSQEMLDTMLRADHVLAKLLGHLDARVGRDHYVLVLTSDHGVCPLPEISRGRNQDSGRVSFKRLSEEANSLLSKAYGTGPVRWIESTAENWLYLNHKLLAQQGLKPADVETALVRGLKDHPGVLAAYGRTHLERVVETDRIGQAIRRSFYPERSGDVVVVLKPYYVPGDDLSGTSHGSPHPYDTHVPCLIYGSQIRAGKHREPVTPQMIPGIVATALGISPPIGVEASVPDIFQAKP